VVELADRGVVLPDLAVPQRLPGALGIAGQVGDDGVDMPLRIERAARVMGEQGIDEVAGLLGLAAAAALIVPALGELLLDQLRHGRFDRRKVRIEDPPIAADQRQDRRGLGHRKGEIETQAPPFDLPDHLAIGQAPIEDALERIPLDLPLKPERARTLAAPDPSFRVLIGV
jgi:hypothetical protein